MDIVNTSIILDVRYKLKDGTYPVKLRLTHKKKQRYISLGVKLTKEAFARVQGEAPRGENKTLRLKLDGIEQKATSIVDKMDYYTFEAFEKKFLDSGKRDDVFSAIESKIETLKAKGQINTAGVYKSTLSSLKLFHGKSSLEFVAVTQDFLDGYEKWMVSNGKEKSTVGFYLRNLKAIINAAIDDDIISDNLTPFGKKKYVIPAARNVKKALPLSDIEKIVKYEAKSDHEAKARDLWIFSYYNNGANIKDIALLKYKNLQSDEITFFRAKSALTKRQNIRPVVTVLTEASKEIIERWGNKPILQNGYIFPILEEGLSVTQEAAKIKAATKMINKYMDRITKVLGIESKVTTYAARFSFSQVIREAGASIEEVSEALGHSTTKVTAGYLNSFKDDKKKKLAASLTAFGK